MFGVFRLATLLASSVFIRVHPPPGPEATPRLGTLQRFALAQGAAPGRRDQTTNEERRADRRLK
jgi:hypothetical protein